MGDLGGGFPGGRLVVGHPISLKTQQFTLLRERTPARLFISGWIGSAEWRLGLIGIVLTEQRGSENPRLWATDSFVGHFQ